MIEFPSTTTVNRILPKDKFIEHLDLTPNLKKKLISDVVHIKILNKFSKSVLGFRDLSELGDSSNVGRYEKEERKESRDEREGDCFSNRESESISSMRASERGVAIQINKGEALEKPIKEVLLLQIDLKKPDFDSKLVEAIARQNPHKLVFLLRYQQYAKLAVYYKKLYIGDWKPFEEVSLTLNGNNMNEVWLSFVVNDNIF